jgi:hypothetical protein
MKAALKKIVPGNAGHRVAEVRDVRGGEVKYDKFSVAETVKTQDHARTMTLDPKTHELFTVTAQVLPERKVEPDTFVVLVVAKSK